MKKKIYLPAIVIAFFVIPSFAQIKKGAIFLGGDIGGSTQKATYSNSTDVSKQNGLNISPVYGKAIKENLVLGLSASINIYNNKSTGSGSEVKQNSYGAAVFIRKYKPIGKSGFSLFAQGDLGYSYSNSKNNPQSTNYSINKRNNVGINLFPGISYTISRKLQLETGLANLLSLNYTTQKQDNGGAIPYSTKANGFSFGSSIDGTSLVYIGFRLLIN